MTRIFFLSFVTLLLPFCETSITFADTTEDVQNNPFAMSLEQLMQVEITGATLTEKSLKNVPAAVTVFTHAEISRLGMDYLHELLNLVPGYQSQRYSDMSTGFNYSSRGRRQGANSREVLLLLDGRPMNDPRTGGPISGTRIPLGQIDRVEIIRGPGSAIYGSNAFTGVINIITVKNENQATISTGTDNHQEGELHLSHQSGDWHSRLYAHGAYDGGQDYTVHDTFSASSITTSDPYRGGDIDLAIGHNNTLLSLYHSQINTDDFYTIELLSNGFNAARSQDTLLTLEQSWNWHKDLATHLLLGHRETSIMLNNQITPAGALALISDPPSSDPLLTESSLKSKAQYLQLNNDWTLDKSNSIQCGLEWRNEDETEARAYNNFDLAELTALMNGELATPVSYYGNFDHFTQIGSEEDRDVLGLYAQYQRPLWQQAELTMGARYDKYSDINGILSPRLAVVQQLTATHTLKLLYGEAFRAPTQAETGLLNNPLQVGNPDLDHETIQTWDLIWMAQWQKMGLNLGWFHNRINNPIAQQIVNTINTYVNLDEKETSQGLEMEANLQVSPQWLLRATVTRLTELPDSALREADTLGSLMINYEKNAWNFNLVGIYHSEREMLSGNSPLILNEYWLLNSKLRYRYNKNWQFFVQAKNLLDEEYQTTAQGNGLVEGIANRGRELGVGVIWKF
ncbi:MAG: TonB-dependent receptor [Desulfocapsaceae bacterium]|nr:TonB-dependent receptor [Desulfocapsaceae bacterium]